MRFIIYKNSVLASFCSLFGSAFIAMAVMALLSGELGILPAIGTIASGFGLIWLGSVISEKKAERKRAKATQAAAAKAPASSAGYTQPRQAAVHTVQKTNVHPAAVPAINEKPVKKAVILAEVCFLLAAALGIWAFYTYGAWTRARSMGAAYASDTTGYNLLSVTIVVESVMYLLMTIACTKTKHTQEASVLHVLGFLGLIAINSVLAVSYYQAYGFGGYTSASGIYHAIISAPLLKIAAYFLMTIFALYAMRKVNANLNSLVKVLWFVPSVLLALACAKNISDSYFIDLLSVLFAKGISLTLRPEYLDILSMIFTVLAVFFTGFLFLRISQLSDVSFQQSTAYVQPDPQPAVHVPPVQERPVQQKSANVSSQSNNQDVEKKIQAYKDLLECGILTQEEYDQKIRELMR